MSSSTQRVPDWLLERMAAGELSEEKTRSLRARLTAQHDEHRLASLAQSNAEVLASYPAGDVAAEVERRLKRAQGQTARPRWARPVWALSLASAAALVAIIALRSPENGGDTASLPSVGSTEENIALKGLEPSLRLYRKTASGHEALTSTSRVHPGDTLQIRYVAAGKRFGVVASIDARGTVTLHLPEAAGPAAALTLDGERALAHAYQLDDSPGFERFAFVTSDAPFATEVVEAALKHGQALPRPLKSWSLTLPKEKP